MSIINYRLVTRSANEILLADPDMRLNTLGMKVNVQPKKAGARTVYNAKSQLSLQRTVTLAATPSCDPCVLNQERLALTLNLSGSTQSKAEMQQLCADFRAAFVSFEADLLAGFVPEVTTVAVGTA